MPRAKPVYCRLELSRECGKEKKNVFTLHTTHHSYCTPSLDLHHPLLQPSADSVADCETTVANINKNKNYRGPALICVCDNHFLFSPPRVTFFASALFSGTIGSTILFFERGVLLLVLMLIYMPRLSHLIWSVRRFLGICRM